jgi:glucuronoarabinoxylan endo-1,4-beta-xylanase
MKWFRILGLLLALAIGQGVRAQTADVTWATTHQTIDGFGVSDAAPDNFCVVTGGYNTCSLTSAQADFFFSPTAGIGLSLLRGWLPEDGSCSTTCTIQDATTMQEAQARGATVWITSFSPPASMKTNGSTNCTDGAGNGALIVGDYAAFGAYMAHYATQVKATYGINLSGISVQNEPSFCAAYSSALWTATQIDTFTKVVGPLLPAGTSVYLPESQATSILQSLADPTMTDGAAVGFVGVVATHDYGSTGPIAYTTGNKHLWETEVSDGNAADATMTSALTYSQQIHNWLTANGNNSANAWFYYTMVNSSGSGNWGLVQSNGTIRKLAYAIGNWSKFVRPGWVRIDATATPQSGVYVSAFKNSSTGAFAIVAVNTNNSGLSQTFSFSGFPAVTTVTPNLTDSNVNLMAQASVSVSSSSFSYVLPAESVTTFAGTANGTSGAPPAPPSGLSASVK